MSSYKKLGCISASRREERRSPRRSQMWVEEDKNATHPIQTFVAGGCSRSEIHVEQQEIIFVRIELPQQVLRMVERIDASKNIAQQDTQSNQQFLVVVNNQYGTVFGVQNLKITPISLPTFLYFPAANPSPVFRAWCRLRVAGASRRVHRQP